ncbi:hypothetical protein CHLRE_12g534945v5 [Chlamydomonas reinhardtii]|uniref:3'-5' exonuclease domain-containing protein n=1 Tax=Chlamydomonas reinhardtii TaxID=3055 RepID=A0A2K3D536_CHLRE|nr:uncharacterized protein CHLRE_12g534945v5 [Chlamydomonas reinhardtii]PNW75639.1 hypothetical protein CHLRE_12g534945v5 [Chlamydomonas reinhardtii]
MEVVDSLPALERMLGALVGVEWLAVDAEGVSLSRDGKLCLLALQPARLLVRTWQWLPGYLVDVSVLSTEAFSHCSRTGGSVAVGSCASVSR